jgi:hypothetical protein
MAGIRRQVTYLPKIKATSTANKRPRKGQVLVDPWYEEFQQEHGVYRGTDNRWMELAREKSVRLPKWGTRLTTGGMRRWLHKLGVPEKEYREDVLGWTMVGNQTRLLRMGDYIERNPDRPLRIWVGEFLEYLKRDEETR